MRITNKIFYVISFFIFCVILLCNNDFKVSSPSIDLTSSSDNCPKTSSFRAEINIIWNKTFGGDYIDVGQSITRSGLGGYAISGWTNSSGAGDLDIWIHPQDAKLACRVSGLSSQESGGIFIGKSFSPGFKQISILGKHFSNHETWWGQKLDLYFVDGILLKVLLIKYQEMTVNLFSLPKQ